MNWFHWNCSSHQTEWRFENRSNSTALPGTVELIGEQRPDRLIEEHRRAQRDRDPESFGRADVHELLGEKVDDAGHFGLWWRDNQRDDPADQLIRRIDSNRFRLSRVFQGIPGYSRVFESFNIQTAHTHVFDVETKTKCRGNSRDELEENEIGFCQNFCLIKANPFPYRAIPSCLIGIEFGWWTLCSGNVLGLCGSRSRERKAFGRHLQFERPSIGDLR